jgi:putative DNA primase/helicase
MNDNAPDRQGSRGAGVAERAGQAPCNNSASSGPDELINAVDLHAAIVEAAGPSIDVADAWDKATDLAIAHPNLTVEQLVCKVLSPPARLHPDDRRRVDAEADRFARELRTDAPGNRPTTSQIPAEPEQTDAGNAARLVSRHGADLRYVSEWGWMAWTGTHWTRDELRARSMMLDVARDIHREAADARDRAEQKALADHARRSQQAQRLQGALWCAQPDLSASTDDFDAQTWLLPVLNGTLDLRTGHLLQHRREDFLTRLAPVEFDPDAACPRWETFLARVLPDPEVREFVQRLVGYMLTGSVAEQCLAFLLGIGRNGKSVFVETLAALWGEFHSATRIETLSVSRGGGIPNDIAALAGARLVTVSETPEGSRLNESLVKDLTGGDTISARFMRAEFFQFKPQFKLLIRGNHKPQIRGTDDGIWRRILLVPFNVQIPRGEVDPNLPDRLLEELPGILAWALRGCMEWQREGLQPPAQVQAAVDGYRAEMDTFGAFLDERCVIATDAKARASKLYSAFKQWCDQAGERFVSQRRFGEALAERGLERRKGGATNVYYWHGIGLLENPGPSDLSDLSPSSSQSRTRNDCYAEPRSETSVRPAVCLRCAGEGCGYCEENPRHESN